MTSALVHYLGCFVSNFNCNGDSKTVGPILHYLHVKRSIQDSFLNKNSRSCFCQLRENDTEWEEI
jgi:hypothetical protein